jgi:hypothetical protein
MRSTKLFLLTALLVGAVSVVPAAAVPITYVHTGVGSGTLSGVGFGAETPLAFTITAVGDTDNVVSCGSTCLFNDNITASIDITGLGTFDFLTATRFFVNNGTGVVGFSRAGSGGADLFDGPAVPVWDMLSSLGPIAGFGDLMQWSFSPVLTTGGVLSFNSSTTESTFTATVGGPTVPEPATLLLLGGGLAAGLQRRLRKRAS